MAQSSPSHQTGFFSVTLTLALWSSWLGRLLLRRKLRGEETEVRIPQGHVLTNLMTMWQYWDRKMWPPGIEPRVSGTAHGAAQCDTTTPQPLVFFSISMWVNLSLACPGRHNFADAEHVEHVGLCRRRTS